MGSIDEQTAPVAAQKRQHSFDIATATRAGTDPFEVEFARLRIDPRLAALPQSVHQFVSGPNSKIETTCPGRPAPIICKGNCQ